MARVFSIIAAMSALMVLLAGGGAYWLSVSQLREVEQSATTAMAAAMSTSIVSQMDTLQRMTDGLAQSQAVVTALSSNSEEAINSEAERLRNVIPYALRVRLLLPSVHEPELLQVPNMGFADLEMVRATLAAKQYPAIQGEGGHRHLAITSVVVQDQQVIGVILVSLKPEIIQQLIAKTNFSSGFIEVKQDQAVIASTGNAAAKIDESQALPLTNSRWRIDLWIGGENGMGDTVLFATIVALPALLACLAFFVGYRKLVAYLRSDQSTILKAAKDMMAGKNVGNYPIVLNEMRPIVSAMAQFKRIIGQDDGSVKAQDVGDVYDFFNESFDMDFVETPAKQLAVEKFASVPIALSSAPAVFDELPLSGFDSGAAAPLADVFRAYDIRGIVGSSLTTDLVYDIGMAIASEAKQLNIKTLVVGRDGRLSSPDLAAALIKGITACGCDVSDIGLVPTPLLYFVTQHTEGRSGVMITGSHNPADYNGLKIVLKSETWSGDKIQWLKKRVETGDYSLGERPGFVEKNSLFQNEYIGMISEDARLARPMKVVVDCGNGAAGQLAPLLLRTLGCDVIELFCDIDGTFPNHHPDPSKAENMADLLTAVKHYAADVGIAFDGDADRLGVVDAGGKIIWPDRQMMLFAKDVLANNRGAQILYDVKCSRHLHQQIVKYGGQALMWKSGHSLMKAKLKETGAALAGEMSGHIFFNDRWFGFDDALYAAARLISILSRDSRGSDEVFAEFPDSINTPELHVSLPENQHAGFMAKMLELADFKDGTVIDIDGMRVEFADGWGLVRGSNTTPVLTMRFEANTADAMQRIQGRFKQLMLKINPDISLPF